MDPTYIKQNQANDMKTNNPNPNPNPNYKHHHNHRDNDPAHHRNPNAAALDLINPNSNASTVNPVCFQIICGRRQRQQIAC